MTGVRSNVCGPRIFAVALMTGAASLGGSAWDWLERARGPVIQIQAWEGFHKCRRPSNGKRRRLPSIVPLHRSDCAASAWQGLSTRHTTYAGNLPATNRLRG